MDGEENLRRRSTVSSFDVSICFVRTDQKTRSLVFDVDRFCVRRIHVCLFRNVSVGSYLKAVFSLCTSCCPSDTSADSVLFPGLRSSYRSSIIVHLKTSMTIFTRHQNWRLRSWFPLSLFTCRRLFYSRAHAPLLNLMSALARVCDRFEFPREINLSIPPGRRSGKRFTWKGNCHFHRLTVASRCRIQTQTNQISWTLPLAFTMSPVK